MKDVVGYVFLFLLYAILAVGFWADARPGDLSWKFLAEIFLLFVAAATLARWTVMAFKKRADRLLPGQKIVGIEEGESPSVLEVVKPRKLRREDKKPKIRRLRRN